MGRHSKPNNEITIIDGMELQVLEQYLQGDLEAIPHEVTQYLTYMEVVRSQFCDRYKDKAYIKKMMLSEPYNLTAARFNRIFEDALNHFYADNNIKAQVWGNVYAEKIERTANALRPLIRTFKDADAWKNMMLAAADLRLKYRKEEESYPEELFRKPARIYSLDIKVMGEGVERADPARLAEWIDTFDISESDRIRIKAEANIIEPKLQLPDVQTDQDRD